MKYDYDSYFYYEYSKNVPFTVRIRVTMTETVEAKSLESSANKAFARFPYFSKKTRVDEEGGYLLEPNEKPLAVLTETEKMPALGSADVNEHLFFITYEGRDIYFNFSHSICDGTGAMFWIKATLWQYLTDTTGETLDSTGIRIPGSPMEDGETALPDPADLLKDEPIGMYKGGNSYMPLGDYLKHYLNPFAGDAVYFPMEMDLQSVLKYAKSNDGSPNSIMAAFMFKTVCRLWESNKKVTQISAGIAKNYREDIGCPNTYRNMVRLLHAKYTKDMRDWPIEKLSTLTRGSMYMQMEPEIGCLEYRNHLSRIDEIDAKTTHKEKCKYATKTSVFRSGIRDSFTISYVGKVDWGDMEKYIAAVQTISDGHLMLELNVVGDRLFVNFQQVNRKREYLDAFLAVLREENIEVKLGEMKEKRLPKIEL